MVVIRLARGGAKKRPFFNIVVADSRLRRDGRFIERVGFYNPVASGAEQPLRVAFDRVEHWTGHGAQMSPTVERLVEQAKSRRLVSAARRPCRARRGPRHAAAWPDDALEVGRIGDAWGLKGWFKVLPYADPPRRCSRRRAGTCSPPTAPRRRPHAQPRCRTTLRDRQRARARRRHRRHRRPTSTTAAPPRRCAARASSSPAPSFPTPARRRVLLGRPDRPGGRQPRRRRRSARSSA